MAENEALGFVETRGLVAAIEAADAMVKAARVRIKTVGNADAALISVICEGDLAACAAAVVPTSWPLFGSSAIWPEQKTRSPHLTAWL